MNLTKNKKLLLVFLCALIVCIISTASYAYFTASVAGNNSAEATVITTGHMEITYAESNVIGTTSNMVPGNHIDKPFTVENTGTVDTAYTIYLNDVINTFATKSDLVYELITSDGRVVAQTTCPSSNTAIASNIALPIGTTHHYTLRVTFKETNVAQDDNMGKAFRARIDLAEDNSTPSYTLLSGNLSTVGSVVKIADEEFYVIGQEDATHIKLLSKWNLNVGRNAKGTATNLQDSDVRGYAWYITSYGTVEFSSSRYWYDLTNSSIKSEYGTSYPVYVYDSHSNLKPYVDNYVTYLTQQGVSVTGRLISYEEIVALGCNASTHYCDSNDNHGGTAPDWVYQTSYWLGSACNDYSVCEVNLYGGLSNYDYYSDGNLGVRPVIILEI